MTTGAGRRASTEPRLLAVLLAVLACADAAAAATHRASLNARERAALVDLERIYLEAEPRPAEGLLAFCRRLTGETTGCREIAQLNRNPRRLLAGVRYRVPYELLTPDYRLSAIRALFPDDRATVEGWQHVGRGEDLPAVALWFTGRAETAAEIRRANGRRDDRLGSGERVRVPDALLTSIFRAPKLAATSPRSAKESTVTLLPSPSPEPGAEAPAPRPAPGGAEESAVTLIPPPPPALEFGEDAQGAYALYRLRGGEALYSAVVVRFTGRVHAEDVNALAEEIALRSGIVDVTDIPIGYPVKVPRDLLLPEFLPTDDPRRIEWEVQRALAEQYKNEIQTRRLAGVTVILDAGHGGADVGASIAGVWESNYVYDVVLRIKRRLETTTHARVEMTTRDGERFVIVDSDVLPFSRGHRVLTTPPYSIADAVVGVHLRWYLANSLFRRQARDGSSGKVLFVSVHADSLHPSLRGATAYIPGAAGTAGTFGKSGSVFSSRKEYREQPRVSFSAGERQRSEGLSRDLAGHVLASFRRGALEIHPFQPVRDRIYRGRRAWVPAVLRYNAVPARLLLEVCNLANAEDRRLLQTRSFRDEVAEAVVDGILAYFGEGPP